MLVEPLKRIAAHWRLPPVKEDAATPLPPAHKRAPLTLETVTLPTAVTPENTALAASILADAGRLEPQDTTREEYYDWGYSLYWASAYSQQCAENIKHRLHPEQARKEMTRLDLLAELHQALRAQRLAYPNYTYFNGYCYQSLRLAGVYGNRDTESRYADYGLGQFLKPGMHLLDIGASAGFMSIYAAMRYGCSAQCVEHNRYMGDMGRAVARFLGVQDQIEFSDTRIQEMQFTRGFDGIFSFAAHWTDDEGIRVQLDEHMAYLHSLLNPGGILFFESHSNDVGDASFDRIMEDIQQGLFTLREKRMLENGTRAFYVLQKQG